MSEVITKTLRFEQQDCCNCGVTFFVPEALQEEALRTKRSFWCPNGHSQSYTTNEADRLRKELAAARQREETIRRECEDAKRLKDVALAVVADLERKERLAKKRSAAGVCPCCHRTVKQMAAHMKTKHPEYGAQPKKAAPKPKSAYVKNRLDAILGSSNTSSRK